MLLQYFYHSLSPKNKDTTKDLAVGVVMEETIGVAKVLLANIDREKRDGIHQRKRGNGCHLH